MKKLAFVFLHLVFFSTLSYSQISNVKVSGDEVTVYDSQGRKIKHFITNGRVFGWSSSIIATFNDPNVVRVYNEEGRKIGEFLTLARPTNVIGDTIICKSEGHHVYVYDINGRKLEDYQE